MKKNTSIICLALGLLFASNLQALSLKNFLSLCASSNINNQTLCDMEINGYITGLQTNYFVSKKAFNSTDSAYRECEGILGGDTAHPTIIGGVYFELPDESIDDLRKEFLGDYPRLVRMHSFDAINEKAGDSQSFSNIFFDFLTQFYKCSIPESDMISADTIGMIQFNLEAQDSHINNKKLNSEIIKAISSPTVF